MSLGIPGLLAEKIAPGFSPNSIPGCALWLDAADDSTLGNIPVGASVTTWTDKSASGTSATAQSAGTGYSVTKTSPRIDAPAVFVNNNNNNIIFNGSYAFLRVNENIQTTQTFTFYAVYTQFTNNQDAYLHSIWANPRSVPDTSRVNFCTGNAFEFGTNGTVIASMDYTPPIGTVALLGFDAETTQYRRYNGLGLQQLSPRGAASFSTDGGGLPIIGYPWNTTTNSGFDNRAATIHFHEIVYYNRIISGTEREQLFKYLNKKWRFTLPEYYEVEPADWTDSWSPAIDALVTANASATVTANISAMGANLSGSSKWASGVLAPNGKIYCIPNNATDILIIDTVAGTATRSAMGANLSGSSKWASGVLAPNGKIYCVPANATNILIIDPVAGTATQSTFGLSLSGNAKWFGGVLAPNGKIYCAPLNATDILIIDPTTDTATRSTMGLTLTDSGKWWGGVLAPNGKIYCIPHNATDILIIDPTTGTATRSVMGASLTGGAKWTGGVLAPNGKIYGIPLISTDILIIDPATGTATRSNMGAVLTGSLNWNGGAFAPNGKIYGVPFYETDILIIDPATGTATRNTLGVNLSGDEKWWGGVLAPNGTIYCIPFSATNILRINTNVAISDKLALTPYFNKY